MSTVLPSHIKTKILTVLSLLLATLLGVLLTCSMAPFDWPILAFVSLLGFIALIDIHLHNTKRLLSIGLAFGLGHYGLGIAWLYHSIHYFGGASSLLASIMVGALVLLMASLFSAPLAWLTACSWLRVKSPWLRSICFASLWVVFEFFKTYLFGGFPWLLLGYSQLHWPLGNLAPVLGVYGVSWFTVLTAATLYPIAAAFALTQDSALRLPSYLATTCSQLANAFKLDPLRPCNQPRCPVKPTAYLLTVFAIWVAAAGLAKIAWTHPEGKPITVSILQDNISLYEKWSSQYPPIYLERYDAMLAASPHAELAVLPEAALPPTFIRLRSAWFAKQQAAALKNHRHVVVGTILEEGPYNVLLMLGASRGQYAKQHLVPFGEFIPYPGFFERIFKQLHIPMSSLKPHGSPADSLNMAGLRLTPSICYEIAYPAEIAEKVRQSQGQILLNLSEDAWFAGTIESDQHLQIGQMRALETGRPAIFATNHGISAFINADGTIIEANTKKTRGVFHATIQPRVGLTPWVQWHRFWMLVLALPCILPYLPRARASL